MVVELDSLRCSVSESEMRTCFFITALFITNLCMQKEAAACRKQTVVEIVNLIRAHALNHRRFQNHLVTFDAEYGDVLFYNKLSQTFGVDEAALQEDFIDFKIVPGMKERFLAAKDDLVLFWATKVPVRFLALREAA